MIVNDSSEKADLLGELLHFQELSQKQKFRDIEEKEDHILTDHLGEIPAQDCVYQQNIVTTQRFLEKVNNVESEIKQNFEKCKKLLETCAVKLMEEITDEHEKQCEQFDLLVSKFKEFNDSSKLDKVAKV